MKPTKETYTELQYAYDFFNKHLFNNSLPDCLITLQREKRTYGYYSPRRFINKNQVQVDEIAMNPSYFSVRSIEESLSTLVHEQVHQWQQHHGKSGRGRYHNKEWAEKMIKVGLMPSSTGKEGGKTTGDSMSHYILSDGAFSRLCKQLITTSFRISWADRFPPRKVVNDVITLELEDVRKGINPALEELNEWGVEIDEIPAEKVQTRVKYSCEICEANVWGKPGLKINCGSCKDKPEFKAMTQNSEMPDR